MTEVPERLARLEQQAVDATKERAYLTAKVDGQADHIREIRNDIHSIKLQLSGYRGFWAGIIFAVSSAAAVAGGTVAALWNKWFG